MPVLPFLALFLTALKGFVYTISVDIYAFRLTLSGILHCILHHIAVHLAANSPKCGANGSLFK